MTIDEARAAAEFGRQHRAYARVAYIGGPDEAEPGFLMSVNETFVFVLYDGQIQQKATRPEDLVFWDDFPSKPRY